MENRTDWATKVSQVFSILPRIGVGKKSVLWLDRIHTTQRISDLLDRPGVHICLDGPTGVGKTSLILTLLESRKLKYVMIQITKSMEWKDFCRQLLQPNKNIEHNIGGEVELGVENALPIAKFRINIGSKYRSDNELDYVNKLSDLWSEHDVASELAKEELILFVDDVERANESLLSRFSDLCKLLTQSYISRRTKIIFVGSGDLYNKLYLHNTSLGDRLLEVNLGGFRNPENSLKLLRSGFDLLRLPHPWSSRSPQQVEELKLCNDAIWEAADGLPKNINRLGQEIAIRVHKTKTITITDIIEESNIITDQHWVEFKEDFPMIIDYLIKHPIAKEVLKRFYEGGISNVHKMENMFLQSNTLGLANNQITEIIKDLTKMNFIIRTGKTGEILFLRDPLAAHTLGVAMNDQSKYDKLLDSRKQSNKLIIEAFQKKPNTQHYQDIYNSRNIFPSREELYDD